MITEGPPHILKLNDDHSVVRGWQMISAETEYDVKSALTGEKAPDIIG